MLIKIVLAVACLAAGMPAAAQRIVKISSVTEAVTPRDREKAAQVYEACKAAKADKARNACFEREFRRRSMIQFVLVVR